MILPGWHEWYTKLAQEPSLSGQDLTAEMKEMKVEA